jgi:hypothetical protein
MGLLMDVYKVPIGASLGVIAGILGLFSRSRRWNSLYEMADQSGSP